VRPPLVAAQATSSNATITVSPQSGTFTVGQTFNVRVYINLKNNYDNVRADIYYNHSRMQYLGVTYNSAFNGSSTTTPGVNGYGHHVSFNDKRVSGGPLTGNHLFVTISYKALSAGSAYQNIGGNHVMYREQNYSTQGFNGGYTIANAPTPTPPTPPKPPTPTPTPPAPPVPSSQGLELSKVAVKDIGYRRAVVTWQTNQPTTSQVNFGDAKNDLKNQKTDNNLKTSHTIVLEGDPLRAGKHYFYQVSSASGTKKVSDNGEFDTKLIPLIIEVKDVTDSGLVGATVTILGKTIMTNNIGEATFAVPEGDVTVFVEKDGIAREHTATINVPEGDATPRITVNLGKSIPVVTSFTETKKPGNTRLLWFIPLLAVIMFLVIRVLRNRSISTAPPSLPPAIDPAMLAQQNADSYQTGGPTHHQSLPEMLGRYDHLKDPETDQFADHNPHHQA
ncbi:MAG: hypothetical protein M3Q14_02115, partial [bacterium]|nr:hypothetical protein [bacterium]